LANATAAGGTRSRTPLPRSVRKATSWLRIGHGTALVQVEGGHRDGPKGRAHMNAYLSRTVEPGDAVASAVNTGGASSERASVFQYRAL
jgi:hypothetical protein